MIITVTNNKGGVGKTTITNELLYLFHNDGFKTLGIDLDPQGNLTGLSGARPEPGINIYSVFREELEAENAIIKGKFYDIITSTKSLSNADSGEFASSAKKNYYLREALEAVKDDYDIIIMDTSPSVGMLVQNALTACDFVLIPIEADVFSYNGLATVASLITEIRKYCNHTLKVLGAVLTRFNKNRSVEKFVSEERVPELLNDIKTRLKIEIPLLESTVRVSTKAKEAQTFREPMCVTYPKEGISRDFMQLYSELRGRMKI